MTDALTQAEFREALSRVVACDALRNAPQLVGFLTFVVERTLAGEGHSIKGYTIATQALGRRDDFDPQTDPIVRVEAGRLRRTLDAYYNGVGSTDPVRIVIPRGTYVPQFVAVEPSPAVLGELAEPAPVPAAEPEAEGPQVAGLDIPARTTAAHETAPESGRIPGSSWRSAAVVALIAGVVAVILAALHYNDSGWLARAVRAPLARSPAGSGAADGRPVLLNDLRHAGLRSAS